MLLDDGGAVHGGAVRPEPSLRQAQRRPWASLQQEKIDDRSDEGSYGRDKLGVGLQAQRRGGMPGLPLGSRFETRSWQLAACRRPAAAPWWGAAPNNPARELGGLETMTQVQP